MPPSAVGPTISIRLVWPYIRLNESRGVSANLASVSEWLVDPEARLPHADAVRLMERSIEAEQDPARGLHAAALVEPEDRAPIEHAARGRATLGAAFEGWARWFPLLNSAAELTLVVEGERAILRYRVVAAPAEPPAFADSVLANLIYFARRYARLDERTWELHLTQARPAYADEYARLFPGRTRFSAPDNALVVPSTHLDAQLLPHSPTLTRAYELRAEALLHRLREQDSTTARVRALVLAHLSGGQVSMQWVADALGTSVPTLRRRLREEASTFSAIVEEVRRRRAEQALRAGEMRIGELAAALGFSTTGAFDRAFKRWSGAPPSAFPLTSSPED